MWQRLLKLLFGIVLLLYIVSAATLVAVVRAARWHPELMRFLDRAWVAFLAHVGSTGPGFISPIILGVVSIVGTMVCVGHVQGAAALAKHWRETALYAGVVLVTSMLLVYGPQFIWQVAKVAQEEHRALVVKSGNLANENDGLRVQVQDVKQNAAQRCVETSGKEIVRLRKQLNAACFNPGRHLTLMDETQLLRRLQSIRIEMEKQKQILYFRINGFSGDAETGRFARTLIPIFENAGWKWRPVAAPQTPAEAMKAKTEQDEQGKWLRDHGLINGIMIFDKDWPKGFGMGVEMAFSQVDLVNDWTQSNRQQTTQLPHLNDLTIWVGYQPVR